MAYTDYFVDPTKSSNGAGSSGDPLQATQIAALVANETRFNFQFKSMGVGGFGTTRWTSVTLKPGEIGTYNTAGFSDVVFRTATGESALAIIDPSSGVASWALETGDVYVFATTQATIQAIATVWQDYYGQVASLVAGEANGSRKRMLRLVATAVADVLDAADYATLDDPANEGCFMLGQDLTAGEWRLAVHAYGEADLSAEAANFMSYTREGPAPGTQHQWGAFSVVEQANVLFENLVVQRFAGKTRGAGIIATCSDTVDGGRNIQSATARGLTIRDCRDNHLRLRNAATGSAAAVIEDCNLAGIAAAKASTLLRVEELGTSGAGNVAWGSIRVEDCFIGNHRTVGIGNAGVLAEPTGSGDGVAVYTKGAAAASAGQSVETTVEITRCTIQGLAGRSNRQLAMDVRNVERRVAESAVWTFDAYKARVVDTAVSACPQLYFDFSIAFMHCLLDMASSDEKITATGSFDIGQGEVNALLISTIMKLTTGGSSPAPHCIGVSMQGRLRMVGCELFDRSPSPDAGDIIICIGSGTPAALPVPRVDLQNTYVSGPAGTDVGFCFLDTGDSSKPTYAFNNLALDNIRSDRVFIHRDDTAGSWVGHAAFRALANVVGVQAFDAGATFAADGHTPASGSYLAITRAANSMFGGVTGYDDEAFTGRIGAFQAGDELPALPPGPGRGRRGQEARL